MNKLECPKCNHKVQPIKRESFFNDDGTITISYCCDECDCEWEETYQITLISKNEID
jgi:hypothetical protein